MKKIKMILIATLLIALIPITTFVTQPQTVKADTDTTKNMISVNGEGEIKVKPDIAYLSIGVETSNKDVAVAQKENKDKMNQLISSLHTLGLKDNDIKTTNYSIYPDYNYAENGKTTLKGYVVMNMISITINNIDSTGTIIDTVTKNGANKINQISFGISNQKEVYLQALKSAVEDSKVKAKTVATTFNAKDVKTIKVTETSLNSNYPVSYESKNLSYDSNSTSINSGELTIKATVTADYQY